MKKYLPTTMVVEETGEILPLSLKKTHYVKILKTEQKIENKYGNTYVQTIQVVEIQGERPKQLELF